MVAFNGASKQALTCSSRHLIYRKPHQYNAIGIVVNYFSVTGILATFILVTFVLVIYKLLYTHPIITDCCKGQMRIICR